MKSRTDHRRFGDAPVGPNETAYKNVGFSGSASPDKGADYAEGLPIFALGGSAGS